MSSELQKKFPHDASLFPHLMDIPSDQLLISRLSEADYKTASFLDQRILTDALPRQTASWSELENLTLPVNPDPYYIFHIGHVGSTLISRLLGELPGALALREPPILRSLTEISPLKAEAHSPWSPETYEMRRDLCVKWLSRTFHGNQRSIIKASSFVSEIAGELMEEGSKAICLYVSLERYLETILAGEGSRAEATQLASVRLVRFNRRMGAPVTNLWALSHVQKIALGWLCEMTSLKSLGDEGIKWVNFDTFLKAPSEQLMTISQHFDLELDKQGAKTLTAGPIMSSYSKAPEHDYSADLRKQLLVQAREQFGAEINRTVDWVEKLAHKHPKIERVMTFASKSA